MSRLLPILLLALLLPASAQAVDGFGGMTWGMQPADVQAMFGDRVIHDPRPKNPPEGTIGGRYLVKGAQFFSAEVDLSAYFTRSGLEVIRLTYRKEKPEQLQEFLDFYTPQWGEPLQTTEREGSKKKKTWAWPWEGVEFRAVYDDKRLVYQRVDYSVKVIERWQKADALVCAILPLGSKCPFPDTYCPQQDSTMPKGRREQTIDLLQSKGEMACVYEDFRVRDARLTFERPREESAKWLDRILHKRLGEGGVERKEGTEVIDLTRWESGVELLVVRKAAGRTKDGTWTGPIQKVRVRRLFEDPAPASE